MNQKFLNVKFAASLTVFWIFVCEAIVAINGLIDTPWAWITLALGVPIFVILVAGLNWLTSEGR